MKFRCDGLDLADAISKVLKATSSKTTSPILEGIKIQAKDDRLIIVATDLEIAIKMTIKAEVTDEGVIVVPGKFFAEYTRKLSSMPVSMNVTENGLLKITYGDNEGYIQLMDVAEYPFVNEVDNECKLEISNIALKNIINKTIFAVATDDSRPILKGELLEITEHDIKAVALDGYRLAIATQKVKSSNINTKIIVPARSLTEVSKLIGDNECDVTIYISSNFIKFDLKDIVLTSRIIEGDFINYKQIIHNDFSTTVTVSRDDLSSAIERASLLSKADKNNLVKFDISEKTMTLTSNSDIGNITEKININLKGDDIKIAFNSRYFTDCMRASGDEVLVLNFTHPINPCVITPIDNDDYLYLIIPIRIHG